MLAAVIPELGRLELREVPDPVIRNSDDVIVRVAASGVCRTDLETMDGGLVSVWGEPELPYVPGHEVAGYVEAIGPEVETVAVGDPVLLHPFVTCGRCSGCRRGADVYCENSRFPGVDATTWGGFAERVTTGERAIVPLGKDADLVALSAYSDAGITAYHAVNRLLPYLTPSTVVVAVGVGGVGHFGVQLLQMMSACTVIAVDADPGRAELALELGAHRAFTGVLADHVATIRELTGGGADVVVDFAGGSQDPEYLLASLCKGGVLSLVGAGRRIELDSLRALSNELTIIANLVGTHRELSDLVSLEAKGLRSLHTTYPLAEVERAVGDLRRGAVSGRAVLIP